MQPLLTIAGFDPSSGAGVTADLLIFAAHGLFGTACITSLTVQSTVGVRSSHPVDPRIIADTLACLDDDLPPAGIKIGMLADQHVVNVVSMFLEGLKTRGSKAPIVLDPVLRSSSGRELLSPKGVQALRSRLLPFVDWVTPNLEELSILASQPLPMREEIASTALVLQKIAGHPINILVTGGHMVPPDDFLLTADGTQHWFPGDYIDTRSTHGTGCALSSALLSRLVLGDDPFAAALAAKQYVTDALRTAVPIGHGHGPMNHLWPLRDLLKEG